VDGKPARVLYAKNGQINAQLPADVEAPGSPPLRISDDTDALDYEIRLTAVAPGLFTAGGGTGQAAATNEDGSANSASNPADAGSVVTLYATGIPAGTRVEVEIGSQSAEVIYTAASPSAPGVRLIAARVPADARRAADVPVTVRVGAPASQTGVTIAVR
jgi:uncharacterized protein (TIGR03437 family)